MELTKTLSAQVGISDAGQALTVSRATCDRNQAPELLAAAPNQVWSWDITKPRGTVKWIYYYLYLVLVTPGTFR